MRSVELFAGGGGLALAAHAAGFTTEDVFEWDRHACDTLIQNRELGHPWVQGTRVHHTDVRDIDWSTLPSGLDLLAAGPPCQPFSTGGKARAADDPRDMFPATCRAIAKLQPRAFVIENVRGLTRKAFEDYLGYIQLRLTHPEIDSHHDETWDDHYRRLQREHTSTREGLRYNLVTRVVNAADYGVPQQRWRLFMVGFRADVNAEWSFPEPTHSGAALRRAMENGSYWRRHRVAVRLRENIRANSGNPDLLPWRTVRDALKGLPKPSKRGHRKVANHILQEGARSYPGHTGSYIDAPSKALKAGVHGVPGGENMIRYEDGSVRYFSVREAARIQTFPESYRFSGPWGEVMRQLGNAVPVVLGEKVLMSVKEHLELATCLAVLDKHPTLRVVA